MKYSHFSLLAGWLLAFTAISSFTACVKKEYDQPPVESYPNLSRTHTIAQIIARHTIGASADLIADSVILEGIVVGDDRTGNFYKNIVIQDSSTGIQIRVDATSTYNNYPVGRKVWIKAKNLYIGDYSGTPQISLDATGTAIPEALVPNFLVGGERNQPVPFKVKKIADLGFSDLNTLVRIDSAQILATQIGTTYADALNNLSANKTVEACSGGTITLRSSGYATFAGATVPSGQGSIFAVITTFGTTKQLTIRDTTDLVFTGGRCGSGGAGGPDMSIADLRAAFTGSAIKAPARTIRGVVISDITNGNVDTRTMVLQDGNSGITIRFEAAHNRSLGDSISLAIGNDSLKLFSGLLQLGATTPNINVLGTGRTVTPRVATVAQIIANAAAWESTLVQVTNATIAGGSTYSGNKTLTDGTTGSLTLYTRTAAVFAAASIPTGTVTVVSVLSKFNTTLQLQMRFEADVTGGTPVVYSFQEPFTTATIGQPIALTGWVDFAEVGDSVWRARSFSNNTYAEAKCFNSAQPNMTAWLITPSINLSVNSFLTFSTSLAFWTHDLLTVHISTNYTSGNPTTATWTQLNPTLPTSGATNYAFLGSGDVNLATYTGQSVRIAFKYTGSQSQSRTTTYQVDDVRVRNQ